MQDRRGSVRDEVIHGGVAERREGGAREGVARPTTGSTHDLRLPAEQLSLRIARKGRAFLARLIWWRDNFVGVVFRGESPAPPVSDLAERLRQSEIKKRQLQRRIDELLSER